MDKDNLNRFDRIVAILIHLQSGSIVKAQDMADRFQVSLRTIYRDIRSLEAAGIPVSGESGIGYSLVDGYRLPPVMFTKEEASTFVAAEKLMQKFSDQTLRAYYELAMYKVKSVLKGNTKDHIAALESQIWVNSSEELYNKNTPSALNILMESISGKTQVSLEYLAPYAEGSTTRIIEPVGLFNESNFWYVLAYCHTRKDYRQFRIDRMLHLKPTDQLFTKEHLNVPDMKSEKRAEGTIKVVISVNKEMAKYTQSGRKYYGYISEKVVGEKIEMTFLTSECQEGLSRWFMMFGDCAEILEPESFKEKVLELLEKTKSNILMPVVA
ncbi:MAG: YafY family transcriptional regulator [Opitutaceae bacterium]|nr:YafY family transcriptional regulator [Cytophagales bacterium]